MKQDLDNLTTEESMALSPDMNSASMRNNLSRVSASNMRKEEILKYALQEAEEKLESLQKQKRLIRGTRKEQSARISLNIEKDKESIEKIEKQLEKLEKNSETMTNAIKKQSQQKIESFKVALKPLQDVIDLIANSKIQIGSQLKEVDEKLEVLKKSEQEQKKLLTKAIEEEKEVSEEKTNFSRTLDEMKKSHLWDYKEFIQDRETKELLFQIKEEKKQKISVLNETDKLIADLTSQIQILTRDIESLRGTSTSMDSLKKNEKEMAQLEEFIRLQCQNFNASGLNEIIEELCIRGNFPISQMVFKEQFRLVEQYELETIEKAKHQQEVFESNISELSKLIEEQETEIYALISIQQTDLQAEKALKKSQKELEELREKFKKFTHLYDVKIQQISDWKSENRNILLITDTERIPSDSQVLEYFYEKLNPLISNPEHWRAMEGVITRYCEKAKERDAMHEKVWLQRQNDSNLIGNKLENLKQVKAIKTTREGERSAVHVEFEKVLALEKKTLKELENSKLEVESARKCNIKTRLDMVVQCNSNFQKIQKTYGDKAVKKMIDKETSQIKVDLEAERIENKQKLEEMYQERTKWQKDQERLWKLMNEEIKPKLVRIHKEKGKLNGEKKSIEKELKTLTEAEDEAHWKLDSLAEKKRLELVREAKKVANCHGGERATKIEQLYKLRNCKESEIIQLESELLKLDCGLIDKETKADLEIIKVKARIKNINSDLSAILKNQKKTDVLEKTLSKTEICPDLEDSRPDDSQFSMRKSFSNPKVGSSDSPKLTISPFELNINEYITDEIKDIDEESTEKTPSAHPYRRPQFEIIEDSGSDVSSEIPCPKDLKYTYDKSEAKYYNFFDTIIPLIEGTIIYKQLKTKSLNTFDPLEGNIYRPEDCGFGVRKIKINKNLSKIEIRQIGKSGAENSIIIDQIISVGVPSLTIEMIKARSKNIEEKPLERTEEFNKAYRNMKMMGNIDYNSPAFLYKAKETCFYPFFVNLRGGRVEFVAEGLQIYKNWVQGLKLLIKHKPELERLKFKISSG